MTRQILVTGASGNLGSRAVRRLLEAGLQVRAASRQPEFLDVPDAVRRVRFDYDRSDTHAAALGGVHGVLLVAPPLDPHADDRLIPFIERAEAAHVNHIVLVSAFGVDAAEDAPLRKVERRLQASPAAYTILRPNFYMENFSTGFLAPTILGSGAIYLAAGDGKTSFISVDDVAAVAAHAFARDLVTREFNLTGPASLTHARVAHLLSGVSGRTINYVPIREEQMIHSAVESGVPEEAARYMAQMYAAVRAGYCSTVTGDVRDVLGRDATSMALFIKEHAPDWNVREPHHV